MTDNIILLILIVSAIIGTIFAHVRIIKTRNRFKRKAIKTFNVKTNVNFIKSFCPLFLSLGGAYFFGLYRNLNVFEVIILYSSCILAGFSVYMISKILKIIFITDEGLFISNRLIKWNDIVEIEEKKYSIKITTKLQFYKNWRISKIFYNITKEDIRLLKSCLTNGNANKQA